MDSVFKSSPMVMALDAFGFGSSQSMTLSVARAQEIASVPNYQVAGSAGEFLDHQTSVQA